jgi:hypothetical protein
MRGAGCHSMAEAGWRPVPGAPGYWASSDGHIWSTIGKTPLRLKASPIKKGYLQVGVRRDGRCKTQLVHRLILEAFKGPCPDGFEARHLDGDNTNNASSNLEWGTPEQNAKDKEQHGTKHRGSQVNGAKLTEAQVATIKRRVRAGEPQRRVAFSMGVSPATVCYLMKGRTWTHVAVGSTA